MPENRMNTHGTIAPAGAFQLAAPAQTGALPERTYRPGKRRYACTVAKMSSSVRYQKESPQQDRLCRVVVELGRLYQKHLGKSWIWRSPRTPRQCCQHSRIRSKQREANEIQLRYIEGADGEDGPLVLARAWNEPASIRREAKVIHGDVHAPMTIGMSANFPSMTSWCEFAFKNSPSA